VILENFGTWCFSGSFCIATTYRSFFSESSEAILEVFHRSTSTVEIIVLRRP
jgi:hypothetical protein